MTNLCYPCIYLIKYAIIFYTFKLLFKIFEAIMNIYIQELKNEIINIIQQPLWFTILQLALAAITAGAIILYIINYITSKRRSCTEKAIDIAKIYSEEIIKNISYITLVLDFAGIDIKNKLKSNHLVNFTKDEFLESGLQESDFDDLFIKIHKGGKLDILISNRALILSPNYNDNLIVKLDLTKNGSIEALTSILHNEFVSLVMKILNTLEYMAMCLNSGIADETVIYQSLHQTFIKLIKYLYFYIAKLNISGCDKYYTNITVLYNLWNSRYIDFHEQENQQKNAVTLLPRKVYGK